MKYQAGTIDNNIVSLSGEFVKILYQKNLPEWAVYHNLKHTVQTVETSMEIASYYKLKNNETEMLSLAAWFHDTGYIYGPDGHEEKSVEIASEFLSQNNYPSGSIKTITDCIMRTKISSKPENLLQCIIRDADLVSLGTQDYFRMNELLKKEFELRQKKSIDKFEWLKRSEQFLSSQNYYTEYARLKLNLQLNLNLKELRRSLKIK